MTDTTTPGGHPGPDRSDGGDPCTRADHRNTASEGGGGAPADDDTRGRPAGAPPSVPGARGPAGSPAPVGPPAPVGTPAPAGSVGAPAPPRRRILADVTPLRTSVDYRRLWVGNTVSVLGQSTTALAVALQVYDLTGSSFSVGLVGLFTLLPLLAFGLYGGAVADAVDRRLLGLWSAGGLCALSLLLAVVVMSGHVQVWFLYTVVALQSVCSPLNGPARNSMVPRLLPAEQLPAANALTSITMTAGTTFGPMLGGLLVGFAGYEAAYAVDALAFTAALYAMWRLPSMRPEGGKSERPSVREGLRFLQTRPNIRMTFFTDLAAMVLASPRALFPAIALIWYDGDARTAGLLASSLAAGALLGGIFSGRLGGVRRHGLAVLLAVAGWGGAVAAFGLTRSLWAGALLLALAGASDTVSMVFRTTMLQADTPDGMRGRLQGVFLVVVAGGPRLGDFVGGASADLIGIRLTLVGGGLACVLAVVLLALRWPRFALYDAQEAGGGGARVGR